MMAGALKQENWPDPREGDVRKRQERGFVEKVTRTVNVKKKKCSCQMKESGWKHTRSS